MGFADHYLNNQSYLRSEMPAIPGEKAGIVIVIPCYNEDRLCDTLNSLWYCERPESKAKVLIVVNSSASSSAEILKQNLKTIDDAKKWIAEHQDKKLSFTIIHKSSVPDKIAGAGFARKTGMDYATCIFNKLNNFSGIIVSLDADCTVEKNYLTAIENAYRHDKKVQCTTIYFEHPTEKSPGYEYEPDIYEAATQYELHLRYHIEFLRRIGFPYAYHTVGSAFSVNTSIYADQGGMNSRKGGEDFYFLHKVFPVVKTIEINDTKITPSPRPSSRVPFGTGPAIRKYINSNRKSLVTYNPSAYLELKELIMLAPQMYGSDKNQIHKMIKNLPSCMGSFMLSADGPDKITEINQNTASADSFIKRFFTWFNTFRAIKFLNYAHHSNYGYLPVIETVIYLFDRMDVNYPDNYNNRELLAIIRDIQKNSNYISHL